MVQEEAESYTSAAYRAPELWDCPSGCTIDDRVDSWALGCTLYFAMYGVSPFEHAGGSLALAVLGGAASLRWPSAPVYPEALRELVRAALAPVPAQRPSAAELLVRARGLQQDGSMSLEGASPDNRV